MRKHYLFLGVTALCSMLVFSTCKLDEFKQIEGIDFEAEYAIPLINSSLNIQDMLDRSNTDLTYLTIEDDGSLTLSYQDEAAILEGEEALEDLPGDFPIPVPDRQTMFPLSEIEEVQIASAHFKSGNLYFDLQSSWEEDLDVTISLPGFTKDGQSLEFMVFLDYQGSLPVQNTSVILDLSGYTLNTTDGDVAINYQAMNSSNQNRTIDGIMGTAGNWAFDNIVGEWAPINYILEADTVVLDLYDNQVEGELYFSDPQLNITVNNSFGVPVLLHFDEISVLTADNEVVQLTGNFMDDGFFIDAPAMNQQGQSLAATFNLDRSNSNIDVIFNAQPKKIWYAMRMTIAPSSGLMEGFILDESKIDVSLAFELPVIGTAKGFVNESLVDLDLGEEDSKNLKEAQIKLITKNDIPIDASIQIYFLDQAGQAVDSIFSGTTEIVNGNSEALTTFLDLTPERLDIIRSSKQVKIRSDFSTIDGGNSPVVIKNNQNLEIKMGIRATLVE